VQEVEINCNYRDDDMHRDRFSATEHRERLRANRVARITTVVITALLVIAFIQFKREFYSEAILLGSATVFCIAILLALRQGKVSAASKSIVLLLAAVFMMLASSGGGLRDVVLHAFPGLIIFSAMLNSLRQTAAITFMVICFFLSLGLGTELGWWQHQTEKTGLVTGVFLSIILIVVGYSIFSLHGDLVGLLGKVQDENTRYMLTKQRIQRIALYDSLTGLPNRLLARERFRDLNIASRVQGTKTALMFIDLDDFKFVNDSSGHESGDEMLKAIGARIESLLRESDTVSRFGGDEFLVIVDDVEGEVELGALAKKLIASISEPVNIFGADHQCSASIGITILPADGDDFDALLKNADMAMYLAKDEGRNNYQFFNDALQQKANRKAGLLSQMRIAIESGELALYYQPKICLSDGYVVGAEALIRWTNKVYGFVSPVELIQLAESSGFINELGDWVIERACQDLKALHDKGRKDLNISINISTVQLRNKELRSRFLEIVERYDIDPKWIDLELTETLLASDDEQLTYNLSKLREAGASLSIDDFGTGYSNLGYLKRFEVETLKIDRSFIHDLPANPNNQAIVRAVLQICEELGMGSVAEGVEDSETACFLKTIGCEFAQGYYWSRPVPIRELEQFL